MFLLTQLSQMKVVLHNSPSKTFHCVFLITRVVAEENPELEGKEKSAHSQNPKTSGEVFQKAPLVFFFSLQHNFQANSAAV